MGREIIYMALEKGHLYKTKAAIIIQSASTGSLESVWAGAFIFVIDVFEKDKYKIMYNGEFFFLERHWSSLTYFDKVSHS